MATFVQPTHNVAGDERRSRGMRPLPDQPRVAAAHGHVMSTAAPTHQVAGGDRVGRTAGTVFVTPSPVYSSYPTSRPIVVTPYLDPSPTVFVTPSSYAPTPIYTGHVAPVKCSRGAWLAIAITALALGALLIFLGAAYWYSLYDAPIMLFTGIAFVIGGAAPLFCLPKE